MNTKHKKLAIISALLLTVSLISVPTFAAGVVKTGQTGDTPYLLFDISSDRTS